MSKGQPPLPAYPRLASGCQLVMQDFHQGPGWVLETPFSSKFFRMGLREERLIRLMDGTRSVEDLLKIAAAATSVHPQEAMQPEEVLYFIQSLQRGNLLREESASSSAPVPKPPFNPMFLKLRLGNPDPLFAFLAKVSQVFPTRLTVVILIGLVISGAYSLFSDFERFQASLAGVLSAANIPGFMAAFLFCKLVHELAHGTVCRRLGGHVPEAGLLFVMFVPLTYVDATAAWRFPEKWKRIFISSAGMLAECVVAAVAALVWARTDLGFINTLAANTILTATVTTLLFNANPLMRFDGYFILSDLTGRPNLYQQATAGSQAWMCRVFLGLRSEKKFPLWITSYGMACLVWRTLLILGLCIGAVAWLHGLGLVMAAIALIAGYSPFLKRLPRTIASWRERGLRFQPVRIVILFGLVAAFVLVPLSPPPSASAVIEAEGISVIRVQCPGRVESIEISSGNEVAAGQILMVLSNPGEKARLEQLRTSAQREALIAHNLGEAGQYALVNEQLQKAASLKKLVEETEAYLDTLIIRAPTGGQVTANGLEELLDAHVSTGRELMTIGSAKARDARIAIPQQDIRRLRPAVGNPVDILVPGRLEVYPGRISAVESTASREIRIAALAANAGGPFAVMARKPDASLANQESSGYELVDPHFYLRAEIIDSNGELMPGETVVVRFPDAPRRTLWIALLRAVDRFIRKASDRFTQPP